MEIIFLEGNFLIKTLSAPEELEAGFRLRHDVYCDELKWVPRSPDGMEKDFYDSFSECIGVYELPEQKLIGHIRLTASPNPFMIDKEFACLMPEGLHVRKGPDVSEVTRLCVEKESRSGNLPISIPQMLYKGMYQWCLFNGTRFLMMVVDHRCFRHLKSSGLIVEALGDFITMPDGVKAAVCRIDWRKFEEISSEKKPEFLEWMSKTQVPLPSQLLSHALY